MPARKPTTTLAPGCPMRPSRPFNEFLVGIKGPLTTPIGGGIRSLNVALRKALDLYVCQRPVRYFTGVPSPVKHPEYVDMVDLPRKHRRYLHRHRVRVRQRRTTSASKTCSKSISPKNMPRSASPIPPGSGSSRSPRKARPAWCGLPSNGRWITSASNVTLVHKGNIMKYTEGAFRNWGYEAGRE